MEENIKEETVMELQAQLEVLVAKDQIRDVLLNYVHGVDRIDGAMIESVFHPDAHLDYGDFNGNPKDFTAQCVTFMRRATPSQHSLSNIKIAVDGDRASSVAYVRALHGGKFRNDGETIDLVGYARYIDQWEKRDGKWKVAKRVVAYDWSQLPVRTVKWPDAYEGNRGRVDESDPAYKLTPKLYG